MKKKLLLVGSMVVSTLLYGQNVPIDFESGGHGADWTWTVFEQNTNTPPPLEIVDNPDPSGINTSAKVAKFTALQTGNRWAGVESNQGSNTGSFTLNSTNNIIKIMVYKTVISPVGIKLAAWGGGWSEGEIKVANTKINEWEQLTFDFSGKNNPPSDVNNGQFNQIIIFPDFPDGARAQDNIIYFDYIWGEGEHHPTSVGINQKNISINKKQLKPNPSNGVFSVNSQFEIEKVEIYNTKGQVISSLNTNSNEVSIDLTGVERGIYFVKVNSNGIISNEKIIIY
jgi:hypothetical protein